MIMCINKYTLLNRPKSKQGIPINPRKEVSGGVNILTPSEPLFKSKQERSVSKMMKHKTTIFHNLLGKTRKNKGAAKRPSKQELQELTDYYNKLTAELPHDWALENLDSEERCHYLMLLKIADYRRMGKSFAILTAFKMGYLYAKGKIELGLPDHEAEKGEK